MTAVLPIRVLRSASALRRLWPVLALLAGSAASAWAAPVQGLYRAEVPVAGQEPEERRQAMEMGLAQVLIKVSGDTRAVGLPQLRGALASPTGYVQQYAYEQRRPATTLLGSQSAPLLVLRLDFDREAVERLLRSAGLPVWGDQRPSTLIWLAVEQSARRTLVGGDSDPELVSVLRDAAERRGLPLLLPLLDLEDQAALPAADVWGNFRDSILRASGRYQPDAVLVGRLYRQADGSWEASWNLYQAVESSSWIARGAYSSQALSQGVDGAADLLAARYAPIGAAESSAAVQLVVDDVVSLAHYAQVMKYLQSLQPVQSVMPQQIEPGRVFFAVTLRGDYRLLEQVIGLSAVLHRVPEVAGDVTAQSGEGRRLWYRMNP